MKPDPIAEATALRSVADAPGVKVAKKSDFTR